MKINEIINQFIKFIKINYKMNYKNVLTYKL